MSVINNINSANKCLRKIFNFRDDKDMPIMAAGVLLYRYDDNKLKVLTINKKDRKKQDIVEDLGGKIEQTDDTLYDTIIREAYEESNGLIKINKERLEKSNILYMNHCKYALALIEATSNECVLKKDDFGNREIKDDIDRTIDWMDYEEFKNAAISPRLGKYTLFSVMSKI